MDLLIELDEEGVHTLFDNRDELFLCLYVGLSRHKLFVHSCQ